MAWFDDNSVGSTFVG